MDKLLQILADGRDHSGEALGEALGISRTAVWKQVKRLLDVGVLVESRRGRGYRIPGGLDLLDKIQLEQALSPGTGSVHPCLNLYGVVTSTNDIARQLAEQRNASGTVILAEQQTAGRGRRGRRGVSPMGRNLYLSVVWGFEGGVRAIEGLSLAVGVAVRRALVSHGIEDLTFKWPNDLYWEYKKLGGILLEVLGDPAGFCQVVIGVGINLNMSRDDAGEIGQDWADIKDIAKKSLSRNALAGAVISELFDMLTDYDRLGFSAYRDEWRQYDAFSDQPVTLMLMDRAIDGVARGVDASGGLLVEVNGELQTFTGGEISMRRAR